MKIFKPLIGLTMEVYIDDIVVKNETRVKHAQHLEEAFFMMRAYNMKLNPAKCAFGVSRRKFQGFMVTQRGIEVSPTQVKFVLKIPVPNNKKKLQRLMGCLAALGLFIARFTDKLRSFFLTLKETSRFNWTDKYEQTFGVVKCYLAKPPIISSPKSSEELYMYLVVSDYVVSVIMFHQI